LFQRHRRLVFFSLYSFASLALLSWSTDRFVQSLKYAFHYLLQPAGFPAVSPLDRWGRFAGRVARLIQADQRALRAESRWLAERLDEERLAMLEEENRRLTASLGLARWPRFTPHPARVWARDAADWFHSVIVRAGDRAPVSIGDAVLTIVDERVAVVGQISELLPNGTARALLLTDPFSSLSAHVVRTGEQGIVEGRGADRLLLNYLFSDSDVRAGDEIVTSGLGEVTPAGLLVGRVLAVQEATRGSFKRAVLVPAAKLNNLRDVVILSAAAAGGRPGSSDGAAAGAGAEK